MSVFLKRVCCSITTGLITFETKSTTLNTPSITSSTGWDKSGFRQDGGPRRSAQTLPDCPDNNSRRTARSVSMVIDFVFILIFRLLRIGALSAFFSHKYSPLSTFSHKYSPCQPFHSSIPHCQLIEWIMSKHIQVYYNMVNKFGHL